MSPLVPLAVGFVVAVVVTPAIRWLSHRHELLDHPNERSSHARPTPRGGGLAIIAAIAGTFIGLGEWGDSSIIPILACAAAIAVVGLLDDIVSLRATLKLVVQILAAAATMSMVDLTLRSIDLPLSGDLRFPFWVGVGLSIFWIVGVTNAYNFMDGVNGIASIEAIVCAMAYAVMFRTHGDAVAVLLCLGLAGGAAGFLVHNLSGSIFMGDVGSATLGFLFATLALRLTSEGTSFIAAVLPLLPFLLDTSITLLRRARRRERLFDAHRSHTYQRLTDLGWSHVAVSLTYGLLASTCAVLAVFWTLFPPLSARVAAALIVAFMITASLLVERRAVQGRY